LTADEHAGERARIGQEYHRRAQTHGDDRYELWSAAASLQHASRVREAARLLYAARVLPKPGQRILEIGCGRLGWLADMLSLGAREGDLAGVDLDDARLAMARAVLPSADLRVADASELPHESGAMSLVIASTVFTSILSPPMRIAVANEVVRVLRPGGALLWYDFAWNNPANKNVRGIRRRELTELFPLLHGTVRSITLAPPLSRAIAPASWTLAAMLETVPLLRTHLIGVLVKS
jgi:ubiquinone/menaquinone biosynthesis C-methylase UbiE